MSREKEYKYEQNIHVPLLNSKKQLYCRMANDIIPYNPERCFECPLWMGDGITACEYYDMLDEREEMPKETKKRTQALIDLKITKEFPDFISVDSDMKNGALIYEMALQFAADAHKGSFRKSTKIPYIVHPVEASGIVKRMFLEKKLELTKVDYEVMAAAALHDVVEDTKCAIEDIWNIFGERIAKLVGEESEDKREYMRPEDSWQIRKEEFLMKLSDAPIEAKMITMGDKLSNLRDLKADFERLGDQMWEKFNQKDKRAQEWYYREVGKELACFSDTRAYKEYMEIMEYIF